MSTKVKAKWNGKYPNFCSGQWTLIVNGVDVTDKIPMNLINSPMNTYGIYNNWRFSSDWDVIWDNYYDGLSCSEWIKENDYWLNEITKDNSIKSDIYYAINSEDFRQGCCGGCI